MKNPHQKYSRFYPMVLGCIPTAGAIIIAFFFNHFMSKALLEPDDFGEAILIGVYLPVILLWIESTLQLNKQS